MKKGASVQQALSKEIINWAQWRSLMRLLCVQPYVYILDYMVLYADSIQN